MTWYVRIGMVIYIETYIQHLGNRLMRLYVHLLPTYSSKFQGMCFLIGGWVVEVGCLVVELYPQVILPAGIPTRG